MSLSSEEIRPQRFGRKDHTSKGIDSSSPNWQRRGDSSPPIKEPGSREKTARIRQGAADHPDQELAPGGDLKCQGINESPLNRVNCQPSKKALKLNYIKANRLRRIVFVFTVNCQRR